MAAFRGAALTPAVCSKCAAGGRHRGDGAPAPGPYDPAFDLPIFVEQRPAAIDRELGPAAQGPAQRSAHAAGCAVLRGHESVEQPGIILEGCRRPSGFAMRRGGDRYHQLTTGVSTAGAVTREDATSEIHTCGGSKCFGAIPATDRCSTLRDCLSRLCGRSAAHGAL